MNAIHVFEFWLAIFYYFYKNNNFYYYCWLQCPTRKKKDWYINSRVGTHFELASTRRDDVNHNDRVANQKEEKDVP